MPGVGRPPPGAGAPPVGCDAPPPEPMPAARGRGKPPLAPPAGCAGALPELLPPPVPMPAARGRGKPPLAGGGLPAAGCDDPPPEPIPAAWGRGRPPLAGGGGVVFAAASVPAFAAGALGGAGGGPGGAGACATGFDGAGEDGLPPHPQVHTPTAANPIHIPTRIVCCIIDMATRLSLLSGIVQLRLIPAACRIHLPRRAPR